MTIYYRSRRLRDQVFRYMSPSLDPDHVVVHDGVTLKAVLRADGELVDSAKATAFYQLRPEYAVLEQRCLPGIRYPAVSEETAGGQVQLDIDGEAVEVDVLHFNRVVWHR